MRRSLLILAALYATAAVIGHARERAGTIACGCSEDCWCKISRRNWLGHQSRFAVPPPAA